MGLRKKIKNLFFCKKYLLKNCSHPNLHLHIFLHMRDCAPILGQMRVDRQYKNKNYLNKRPIGGARKTAQNEHPKRFLHKRLFQEVFQYS